MPVVLSFLSFGYREKGGAVSYTHLRFDGKAAQFLEGFLYGCAVFAHDAGVVAAHLVPEMVQRKLAVQDTAVQGTERAERIRREAVSYTHLRRRRGAAPRAGN